MKDKLDNIRVGFGWKLAEVKKPLLAWMGLLTGCLLTGELLANELFSSPSIWLMRPGVQVGKPSAGLTFDALLGFQPTGDPSQVLALLGRVVNHTKKITSTVHTPANHYTQPCFH